MGDEGGTVAAVVAEYVARLGTSHVFTYPGDPTIEILESLRRRDVASVLGRREGTAAFMAEGYAKGWRATKLAESMDCDGVRVTSPAELEKAVEGPDALTRPLVIEAVIDPAQYESQF